MHIASFAGIAPVNNPAIAVAVVIDNPKVGSYYGTAVSAPVFAEVAQQVLEYLGVPHDVDVQQPRTPAKKAEKVELAEDDADADQDQVNTLFAAVNDLPTDDPLRAPAPPRPAPNQRVASVEAPSADPTLRPAPPATPAVAPEKNSAAPQGPQVLTIHDGKQITVPTLIGLPVRKVIEAAAAAGLDVQITGRGTAREQAPAPGTQVPTGTKIVVHCGH
jgi:cell division protein FtsI (penicillin-binding protein 3)